MIFVRRRALARSVFFLSLIFVGQRGYMSSTAYVPVTLEELVAASQTILVADADGESEVRLPFSKWKFWKKDAYRKKIYWFRPVETLKNMSVIKIGARISVVESDWGSEYRRRKIYEETGTHMSPVYRRYMPMGEIGSRRILFLTGGSREDGADFRYTYVATEESETLKDRIRALIQEDSRQQERETANEEPSLERADRYGAALGAWAAKNKFRIKINGDDLLDYSPGAGGWDQVSWEPLVEAGRPMKEKRRETLRSLIQRSGCPSTELGSFFDRLGKDASMDKNLVKDRLSCLGTVELIALEFSSD